MNVLLIEDNPEFTRQIRDLLAKTTGEPFELHCEERLAAALERLSGGGIDVVLLDLTLPGARGLEAFSRTHAHAPGVPIVVLTGPSEEAIAVKALQSGAQDSLAKKDVSSQTLERSLRHAIERQQGEGQWALARRMESIGQLAAGIAHEINTPIQYIGDSVHFLRGCFLDLQNLIERYRQLQDACAAGAVASELVSEVRQVEAGIDLPFLQEEIPRAFERTLEGIEHVANIVRAMKEFSHPSRKEKVAADLNKAIRDTLAVTRNEYKYVAEIETDFGPLPPVVCHVGDLNQVFLNLIVNAAHAIGQANGGGPSKGKIRIQTRREGDTVCVAIGDTGVGIAEDIRPRIFDPFFTTKEVGRGTGQGLSIARSIVVDKHAGNLWFESELGQGSTFYVRLPISGADTHQPQEAA